FFSKNNIENIVQDSFYGHNNINLEEIETRMRLTEQEIGNAETLLEFLKDVIPLYRGSITPIKENPEIFAVELPNDIKQELRVDFEERYLLTPNMEISSGRNDIEGITLKDPLIAAIIEKVKNDAFSETTEFYGRTAAISSPEIDRVVAIYHVKIRYLVNTKQKTIMEEIVMFGTDLVDIKLVDQSIIKKVWNSRWLNHGRPGRLISNHLNKILKSDKLEALFNKVAQQRLTEIKEERIKLKKRLERQGFIKDLEGIDDIDIVGQDLITITLVYPSNK
ncbi:MAG: hypothetical protein ACTSRA_18910, partial [Promethearchaeota archaeon]